MNCSLGDLAVVIRGKSRGRFVLVIDEGFYGLGWWFVEVVGNKAEAVRGQEMVLVQQGHIRDAWLRPIRDTPGTDETPIYAGLPKERIAA